MFNKYFKISFRKFPLILLFCFLAVSICLADEESFSQRLVTAAKERTTHAVTYDGSYRSIKYPMGDVADNKGVCTDLVIRSYRKLGIDLQKLVHEDMKANFSVYPKNWGLARTDANIDHRRVPNLQRFFERKGKLLPKSRKAQDYHSGDLVTWMLPGNLPHIGIVSDHKVSGTTRPMILHNIGQGPKEDDILLEYPITGHYKYMR
ncbi:MAG: DUF1287 domain-containing protein [Nitrospinales bacterium]